MQTVNVFSQLRLRLLRFEQGEGQVAHLVLPELQAHTEPL